MQSYDPNAVNYECPRCFNNAYPCGCVKREFPLDNSVIDSPRDLSIKNKYVNGRKKSRILREARKKIAKDRSTGRAFS